MTLKFQVGKTYACRSICDHECVFTFTVVSRTAQSIVIAGNANLPMANPAIGGARRKVRVWNGVEQVDPLGRYSMAPVLGADDVQG